MIPLFKLCLLVGLTAGVSVTIGIPISMAKTNPKNSTQLGTGNIDNSREGGANIRQMSSLSPRVNKCLEEVNENKQPIEFGSQESENICWETESGSLPLNNPDEYSSFFKGRWGEGVQSWSMSNNQNQWTQICQGFNQTSSTWVILVSSGDEGEQYLGLCDGTELNSTKFVKKKKETKGTDSEKLTLSICNSDCWDLSQQESHSDSKTSLLTQEKKDNWKKVLFYKN